MNPRRRRLLIPGLLVVLILIVLVVSIGRQAAGVEPEPPAERLGLVDDVRITESSGLAISHQDPDLAYTINDSGNVDAVFAIELSTGDVVGTTTLTGTNWRDTEALALHDGTLWVADVGDNTGVRDEVALHSLDEPGRGDSTTTAARHRLVHPDGPLDVESLAIDPTSGEMVMVSKQVLAGQLLRLPADPSTDGVTQVEATDVQTLSLATDAAWTPDGRHVVVRNYGQAQVLDPATGDVEVTFRLPEQPQGESLAVDPDGASVVIGSEGQPFQLWRVALPIDTDADADAEAEAEAGTQPGAVADDAVQRRWLTPLLSVVALGVLAAVAAWMVRRPRRKARRR
ncbi:hypothetical protein [Aeromicrobium sp. CTD01-1L150]|uniref:hypothetical protein n=1 Tax=Aeromicrobium sp. CTD01-1L150 TaxID=3341830 RepID=UPI0035BF8E91